MPRPNRRFCQCGLVLEGHPVCTSCEVLAHTDKRYCMVEGSDILVGYITVGTVCYNCKQEDKAKKQRSIKYQKKMAIQRRAQRAYRLRNLDAMRAKEKELARENRPKINAALRMKLAHSPQAAQKKRDDHKAWIVKHPGYYKAQYQKRREKSIQYMRDRRKKQREALSIQKKPEAPETL